MRHDVAIAKEARKAREERVLKSNKQAQMMGICSGKGQDAAAEDGGGLLKGAPA